MKRKHSEDVDDDYFSFAHLFPKSRRLDAELLSSMVEEVPAMSLPVFEQQQEHLPSPSVIQSGDEKAIVLYNPNSKSTFPFLKSPTSPEFSVIVKSDLVLALQDFLYGSENSRLPVTAEEKTAGDQGKRESNDRLAVVPWVASRHHLTCGPAVAMEAENMEVDMMDTEDNNEAMAEGAERLQQWQQQLQHCMAPQLYQNMPLPVTW